ncbi:hypothetical protein LPJ59_006131, partial [Coemansia sp. RSA 2399]
SAPESFADVVSAPSLLRKVRDVIEFCSVDEFYKMDESLHPSSSPQQQETVAAAAEDDDDSAAVVPGEPSEEAPEMPLDPGPDPQSASANDQ